RTTGVGTAVVKTKRLIWFHHRGAGEAHVGDVTDPFVALGRRKQVVLGAVEHLPRLVEIQERAADAVQVAAAASPHPVVNEQPALIGLDGRRTGASFQTLPAAHRSEDEPMAAPMHEVRARRIENVAERRMTTVRRPVENGVLLIDLAGEDDAVAIGRGQQVLALGEGLEVLGSGKPDFRALGTGVAPGEIVGAFQKRKARVVAVTGDEDLRIVALHLNWLGVDVPADPVSAEPDAEHEVHADLVHAEHARIVAFTPLDDCRVVDAVGPGDSARGHDGIAGVALEDSLVSHGVPFLLRAIRSQRSYEPVQSLRSVEVSGAPTRLPTRARDRYLRSTRPVAPSFRLETATWVIDLIGLHFLSDFKKDVELIVLGQPARPHALQSPLTRFTFLPGDRCRP